MAKSLIEYISEEDYPRYQELLQKAEDARAAAPKKERAPRGPLTLEQKLKAAETRKAKAEALLAQLLAQQNGEN